MDLILCHTTADFDTLGAAVGVSRLQPGARVVLTGGAHPTVREFLALHRDEYALIERRAVDPAEIRSLTIVDTQWRDRLGKAAEWLDRSNISISLYDHHAGQGDIVADRRWVEAVGSATTLVVEQLQAAAIVLSASEATVMALGIHVDTGSLTFDHTTVRDAAALLWLMQQGAVLKTIAEYVEPGLSPLLQDLLGLALETLHTETVQGITLGWVLLTVEDYVPGLSSLASRLISLTESDALLLGTRYPWGDATQERLTLIGRIAGGASIASQTAQMNLTELFAPWGGGGHAAAAAVTLRTEDAASVMAEVVQQLKAQIPRPPTARELMSSPVRTIRPETTIAEAQRILLRYGHSGLSVVDERDRLLGIISRRDIDLALHHGFSHAPVKGYMTPTLKTITPETALSEIESLMVTYDIGRLPVLEQGELVGIVTRTDVLRQLHQDYRNRHSRPHPHASACPLPNVLRDRLRDRLAPALWNILTVAADHANQRGWQLYVVGGAVRDLLLAQPDQTVLLEDVDLVVDGVQETTQETMQGAGMELARSLQERYPEARLEIHGRFQTAALLWHHDPELDSLWIDIATARTEFYPYPAANPQVEASSIRQDLYRRDFTINALAVRLTSPRLGELLDFFGGVTDLQTRQVRVLHANSLIEDPTRIYRAVRFAVRLKFQIEPQTEGYIRHAIDSGIYHRIQAEMKDTPALQTRLRRELKLILEAPYWKAALRLLGDLDALCCLHPTLRLTAPLWQRLRRVDRWLRRFDPDHTLEHWQLLLEALILQLHPVDRTTVAENLQLPLESVRRVQQFAQIKAAIETQLAHSQRPSQVVQGLHPLDRATVILLAADSPLLRRLIWRYLTDWSTVKACLDGNDLKALGYKPGQQFKPMLEALLAATLDGVIHTRADAEVFLQTHFPRSDSAQ